MCCTTDAATHDEWPIRSGARVCHRSRMNDARAIRITGLAAWLLVGLPVVIQGANTKGLMAQWAVAFILFGALFIADLHRPSLVFLALAGGCVVVTTLLLCDGFEGALMVLIAMRLGARVDRRTGIAWIIIQTLLLAVAIAIHWTPRSAILLTPPYLGFQLVAFFTMRQMRATEELNTELRVLHEIVADSSRIAERLRIAQELHDAVGHHLTALTLNLEAALQRTDGDAKRDVQTAQTLARQLLADVRGIVAEKQDAVNLAHALRTLVEVVPRPKIHLEIDEELRVDDPERAHTILRCTQEIATNAARHSGAENLWIVIERDGDGFRIRAHDDGRGSTTSRDGFGLRGMRARLERAGGELSVASQPGRGFDVVAVVR
jgi:signal transduction histidine kinase